MLLLTLLACGSDPVPSTSSPTVQPVPSSPAPSQPSDTSGNTLLGPDPPWLTDDRYVFVTSGEAIEADISCDGSGETLITGSDINQNGIAEWAVADGWECVYRDQYATITVFEGTEVIATRRQDDYPSKVSLMATADVDGDGFAELLWRACLGSRCRIHVTGNTDPLDDSVVALAAPEDDFALTPKAFDILPGVPDQILGAWWLSGNVLTLGPVPHIGGTDDAPILMDPEEAILDARLGPYTYTQTEPRWYANDVHLIMEPAGSPTHFLVATWGDDATSTSVNGHLYICPIQAPLDLQDDCSKVEAEEDLGMQVIDADLDGDGVHELLVNGDTDPDAAGSLWIFERDGRWRATIRGLGTNSFGADPTFVVDDTGARWLLARSDEWRGSIFAFRATQLVGDLTTDDADRIFVNPDGIGFINATAYRETPEGPLLLLVGASPMYRLPFTP